MPKEDVYDKLNRLRESKHGAEQKELTDRFEKLLVEVGKDEAYLQNENTQKVVKFLTDSILSITTYMKDLYHVEVDEVGKINDMLARRTSYQNMLRMFGSRESIETRKQTIEQEINWAVESIDNEFEYPKE